MLVGIGVCGLGYQHELTEYSGGEEEGDRGEEEGGLLFNLGRAPEWPAEGLSGNLARALQSSQDKRKWCGTCA